MSLYSIDTTLILYRHNTVTLLTSYQHCIDIESILYRHYTSTILTSYRHYKIKGLITLYQLSVYDNFHIAWFFTIYPMMCYCCQIILLTLYWHHIEALRLSHRYFIDILLTSSIDLKRLVWNIKRKKVDCNGHPSMLSTFQIYNVKNQIKSSTL